MSDKLSNIHNFEQSLYTEVEQKFLPLYPELFAEKRISAHPVEQFYVSHPSEPYSLRFREYVDNAGMLRHMATLKDRGAPTPNGLERLEIEVPISQHLYEYYHTDLPTVRKLRADLADGVVIDFFEDGHTHVESENPTSWNTYIEKHGNTFIDMTGDTSVDNESIAHRRYREQHDGIDALVPEKALDTKILLDEILAQVQATCPVFVKICGRSGAGKSTLLTMLRQCLLEQGTESLALSTDDYHRGDTWLRAHNNNQPWTQWDDAIVYDTKTFANDLSSLAAGNAFPKRSIDWQTVEPHIEGFCNPAPVVFIEGIYAGHDDLRSFSTLTYTMPTPFSTSVGRRIARDMQERPQFCDPAESLSYILNQAEPAWRQQSTQNDHYSG